MLESRVLPHRYEEEDTCHMRRRIHAGVTRPATHVWCLAGDAQVTVKVRQA
jgi:hypothetical protein